VVLQNILDQTSLKPSRVLDHDVFILQAVDTPTAINEAAKLAALPEVLACCPIQRRRAAKLGAYAPKPTDPYFKYQWYLEHRGEDGHSLGVDLNVRAAWPFATGKGVTIALGDDGVDFAHPDLVRRLECAPHFNFETGTTNGEPQSNTANHGTAVAGLAVARGYEQRGMIGTAFRARLASWVIWMANDDYLVDDERMADMFQYASNQVAVQNHSWGNAYEFQLDPTLLQRLAISNAVTHGRGGKGVVMVRAGGNSRNRPDWGNATGDANDDGYANSPFAIAATAVRTDGRATSYSSPGACLLVAAPSGDQEQNFPTIFTTDRVGASGYNQISFTNDLANYAFDNVGFSGTSAAAPQIAGVAALILSANPQLSYRDVQQIMLLSARHFDPQDPDLTTNSAGLVVSHNDGFGVPDAGVAVQLALIWTNRPPLVNVALTNAEPRDIPDDGLRLEMLGSNVPEALKRIHCLPSAGPHADTPTLAVPWVDVGLATNAIGMDLHGKAALMERGINYFREKIQFAADAGAAFAVVSNNRDGDLLVRMGETDYTPIPAIFISQNDGVALRSYLEQNTNATAQIRLDSAVYSFTITHALACEHVGVRLTAEHPCRGDLRITLTSPGGTRSVLQHINADLTGGPTDWTYYSTHHFFESSQGIWTVAVSDEAPDNTGQVEFVTLIIQGAALTDSDRDGLDDTWELTYFPTLTQGPQDDPDADGFSNLREYLMHTNPLIDERPLVPNLAVWNPNLVRFSWPSTVARRYEVWTAAEALAPWTKLADVPGTFPETLWFAPHTNRTQQFFQIRLAP
jgi:subtilisin-like proprotein convertase family protein/subtilisin family serine protease